MLSSLSSDSHCPTTVTVERLLALKASIDFADVDHGLLLLRSLANVTLVNVCDVAAPVLFADFYSAVYHGYDSLLDPIWSLCTTELRQRLLTSFFDRLEPTVFHITAAFNRPSTLRLLLRLWHRDLCAESKPAEYSSWHGFTPLMVAATKGHLSIVEILLKNGVELTGTDLSHNLTAIDWAIICDQPSVADRLVKALSPSNREKFVRSRIEQFKALRTALDIQRFHDLARVLMHIALSQDTRHFLLNYEVFLVVAGTDSFASCDCMSTALMFLCASALVAKDQTQTFLDPALSHLRMRQMVDFCLRKIHAFHIGPFRMLPLVATLALQMILYSAMTAPLQHFLDNWPELRELPTDSWCLVMKALDTYGKCRHEFPFPDPRLRTEAFKAWKYYEKVIQPHLHHFLQGLPFRSQHRAITFPNTQIDNINQQCLLSYSCNHTDLDKRPTPQSISILAPQTATEVAASLQLSEPAFMSWEMTFSRLRESPIPHPIKFTKIVPGRLMPEEADEQPSFYEDDYLSAVGCLSETSQLTALMVYPEFLTSTLDCDPDVSFVNCWPVDALNSESSDPGSPGGVPLEQRKTYAQACDDSSLPLAATPAQFRDQKSALVQCYLDVLFASHTAQHCTDYDPFDPETDDVTDERLVERTVMLYHTLFKDCTLPTETAQLLRQNKGCQEEDEAPIVAAGICSDPVGHIVVQPVSCTRFQDNFRALLQLAPEQVVRPEPKPDFQLVVPKGNDHELGRSYFGGRITLAVAEMKERKEVFVAVRELPRTDRHDFCVRRLQDFVKKPFGNAHLLGYREFLHTDCSWMLARDVCDWNLDEFLYEGPLTGDFSNMQKETLPLIYHLIRGLEFLHSRTTTLFHGNLKPSNLLIDSTRTLRLVDFGFGKLCTLPHGYMGPCESEPRRLHPVCWKPPEYYDVNTTYMARSDVHSAAMLGYYMLTLGRRHPFIQERSMSAKCLKDKVRLGLHELDDQVPPEAVDLFNGMLHVDPEDRPDAALVLQHPLFWSDLKRSAFVLAVAARLESEDETERLGQLLDGDGAEPDLCSSGDWRSEMEPILLDSVDMDTEPSVSSLLRFVRRCVRRRRQLSCTTGCKRATQVTHFMDTFPSLMTKVYRVIASSSTDKNALAHFFTSPR